MSGAVRRDAQEQDSGGGNIYTTHMTTPVDRKDFVMGHIVGLSGEEEDAYCSRTKFIIHLGSNRG